MSRHIITDERYSYVFGWDQMLQSFYLQKHDLNIEEEDDRIIVWLGGGDSPMPWLEDLVNLANIHGLLINHDTQVKLYGEKDQGI